MTEAQIQAKIIRHLTLKGWDAIKLIQTNTNGIPDLMALKNGTTIFIEIKRPGQNATALQAYRIEKLQQNGFTALVARSVADVEAVIRMY